MAVLNTLAVAGVIGILATHAQAASTPERDAARRGRMTYGRYCVPCHGAEARGDGLRAAELRITVPDLTTIARRHGGTYPYDSVVRTIMKGSEVKGHGATDDMPAWGPPLNQSDGMAAMVAAVRDLGHFLWSVQRTE